MKILHFISSAAAGGAEIYVKDLSINMQRNGHSVHIVFLSRANEVNRCEIFERNFLSDLKVKGITYDFIGHRSTVNPIYGILSFRKILQKIKPDLIHCHLYYGALFSLFMKNYPVVYTHHNIKLKAPSWLYWFLDFKIKYYIGICRACNKLLESVTNNEVSLIHNAVELERLNICEKVLNDSNVVNIIIVGSLTEQKNHSLLIDSLALLSEEGISFHLNVAGEGPLEKDIKLLVASLNLEQHITFLGNVSNVAQHLKNNDIFALSSLWEGLPISQIEATLLGLPVIVTDVGGCAEIVCETDNGIVVDDFSAHKYSKALKVLIESKEIREKYSLNALNNSSMYKIDFSVKAHIHLYEKIINK